MTELNLIKTRFADGLWQGLLIATPPPAAAAPAPVLSAHLGARALPPPTVSPAGEAGRWVVELRVPLEAVGDGSHTLSIRRDGTDRVLARITLIAGEPLADDIRAEVDLLRAELDLLKAAFRRHLGPGGSSA